MKIIKTTKLTKVPTNTLFKLCVVAIKYSHKIKLIPPEKLVKTIADLDMVISYRAKTSGTNIIGPQKPATKITKSTTL